MLIHSVLIANPDHSAATVVARELEDAGYRVTVVKDAAGALRALRKKRHDLALLDRACQATSVPDLLRQIKSAEGNALVRIIVTSDDTGESAAVEVLRSGADDLLTKPFTLGELVARVALSLRRPPVREANESITLAGRIQIDDASHRVTVDEELVELSPREYRLLHFFARHVDQLYSREQLLSFVWKRSRGLGKRTVDVHVRRLRCALAPFACDHYLQTVRGVGYRFVPGIGKTPPAASLRNRPAPHRGA